MAYLLAMTGEWEDAVDEVRALEHEARSSDVGYYVTMLGTAHELLIPLGAVEDAKSMLLRFERFRSSDDVQERCGYASAEAAILLAEGKHAEALEAAERALEGLPMIGAASEPVKGGFVQALEAALQLGDLAQAKELLGRIDALRPRERTPYLQAQSARFRARIGAAGDERSVEQAFKNAEQIFREHGIRFWLGLTQLEHAEWLGEQGRNGDADPLRAEARELFERLGATPWIERASWSAAEVPA
jgi:tetratricopeptide (TPR) repeat protein